MGEVLSKDTNEMQEREESKSQEKSEDFKIQVKERTFLVHRYILAKSSEYFRLMFAKPHENFCVADFELEVVDFCIEFMYKGRLSITADMAIKMLKIAHEWKMVEMTDICENILRENLYIDTILSYQRLAALYELQNLLADCDKFISNNISELTKSGKANDLKFPELISILQKEDLNCHVQDLWKICTSWASTNYQYCDVVQHFPFQKFPIEDFASYVLKENHIANCHKCKETVTAKRLSAANTSADVTIVNS